ncbi:MAG: hypothetical protein ACI8T1_001652 [Verrucomicrobiales bacterium]|jgi:hypothetical protein
MRTFLFSTSVALALTGPAFLVSCKIQSNHVIETLHEIKPIEINVNVRVEKELDEFFEDLDEASTTVASNDDTSSTTTHE